MNTLRTNSERQVG